MMKYAILMSQPDDHIIDLLLTTEVNKLESVVGSAHYCCNSVFSCIVCTNPMGCITKTLK